MKRIELLSPARDLSCGLAAIDHGADAVYIGAPTHSARAAAGCSVDDIHRLCNYAHVYGARVYVALNTLIRDDELQDVERLVWALYRAGVDALIVQDMGLARLHLPPISLHASTQTDNRTADRVRFLRSAGFNQVVLARELSLREIADIHRRCPDVSLEVFVHGALCVCYSGQCYASQACMGRSANRGECAQFCRLPFSLTDAAGRTLARRRHLLSLRDMCRLDHLEALLDAGVSSLKIEGRLKGVDYVKNVTAAYRRRLDEIYARRPTDYGPASSGHTTISFTPQVDKSFNRGFTTYFLSGPRTDVAHTDTPKAMGEEAAVVVGVKSDKRKVKSEVTVRPRTPLHNGDGMCYIDARGTLQGFRVNRVEPIDAHTVRLHTTEPTRPQSGAVLYRNHDQAFATLLAGPTAERRIPITWTLSETPFGYRLTATDHDGHRVDRTISTPHTPALKPQAAAIRAQLLRLGQTPFASTEEDIRIETDGERFIPASMLGEARRMVCERLIQVRRMSHRPCGVGPGDRRGRPYDCVGRDEYTAPTDYRLNVMNRAAHAFYVDRGIEPTEPAFELLPTEHIRGRQIMECRHCVRFSLGLCPKRQGKGSGNAEPLYLQADDGRKYRLEFDCGQCRMTVFNVE